MAEEKKQTTDVEDTSKTSDAKDTTDVSEEKGFEESLSTEEMAKQLGLSEETVKEMLSLSNLEREKNPYLKSDLTDVPTIIEDASGERIDDLESGETVEIADGELTANEDGTIHCESEYLGEFDYDPELFAYGYKEVVEDDGTVGQLPILKYVGHSGTDGAGSDGTFLHGVLGDKTFGGMNFDCHSSFEIPEGLKSGDYMFEGNKELIFQPRLPDSLRSGHYMFANCSKLEYGSYEAKDGEFFLTNSGGEIYFPEEFEDGSSMYQGSEKFKGDFGEMPSGLVNGLNMFESTQLGEKGEGFFAWYTHEKPEWGGKITPALSKAMAKDMVNDIANEDVKEAADNADYLIDEDGTISEENEKVLEELQEEGVVDKDTIEQSQTATGLSYQEDIYNGRVSSEVEIASNGARSDNKIYNASTDSYQYDQTGELKSDDKGGLAWQRWVIDGVVGVGAFALGKKLTGSTLAGLAIGIGGTAALDMTDILPESFSPILKATANILPEGSVKDTLNDWADDLSGSTVDEQAEYWDAQNVATEHQEMRLEDSVKAANSVMIQDVSDSMYNNGRMTATTMALWSTAKKGESSAQTVNDYVVSKCTDAMEEQWAKEIGDGEPTAEQKEDMKTYYTKMFEALSLYNDGAQKGIGEAFGEGTARAEMSQQGLEMVNRAYMTGLMDSYVEMNEKYEFMTTEELKALQDSCNIPGVGDLTQYTDASSFDDLKAEASVELESLISMDSLEQEEAEANGTEYMPDYGLSEDSVLFDGKDTASVSKDTKTETKEAETSDRGAEAEARLGFTGNENDSTMTKDAELEVE